MKTINNTREFYSNVTRQELNVPRSNSTLYLLKLKSDWLQRIYQEYLDCKSAFGQVVFATLTYNNICVPRFRYKTPDGEDRSFMTFSKKDYRRFVSNLRKRWERAGITDNVAYRFKIMFANEFGQDTEKTMRPHYHILLFLNKEILAYERSRYFQYLRDTHDLKCTFDIWFKRLIQHYWKASKSDTPLGMAMWTPGESVFVDGEFVLRYVSKYMFKDSAFTRQPEVQEYLDYYGELPDDGKRKGAFTSHWQSQHFGESLKYIYDKEENYINGYDFNFLSDIKKGRRVLYTCPKYIDNKVCREFDKDRNTWKLTQRGMDLKSKKFLKLYSDLCVKYGKLFQDSVFETRLTESEFKKNPSLCEKFTSYQAFKDFLHNVDSRNFVERTVLYGLVWSGCMVTRERFRELKPLLTNPDTILAASFAQYYDILSASFNRFPDIQCETGVFKYNYKFGCNFAKDSPNGVVIPCCEADNKYVRIEDIGIFNDSSKFLELFELVQENYSKRLDGQYKELLIYNKKAKFNLYKSIA